MNGLWAKIEKGENFYVKKLFFPSVIQPSIALPCLSCSMLAHAGWVKGKSWASVINPL